MNITTNITQHLNLSFPLMMAPMYLVSNEEMMKAAIRNGIAGVFPAMNYDSNGLKNVIANLHSYKTNFQSGNYGVNIIVQKSNPVFEEQLAVCVGLKVPFFTTSLGNPSIVIEKAHSYGAKVYCDVTNLTHAKKCANAGCDGFIAVGQGAGGHAGPYTLQVLVPALIENFPEIPVVASGGIANGTGILSMLSLGASAISMGTRFIASHECKVSEEYKKAILEAGMEDIVLSERISGTPNSIINTPYAKKIGLKQNWIEKLITKNPATKIYFKKILQKKNMTLLQKSILPGNYNNLWIAGQTAELINDIQFCDDIIQQLKQETFEGFTQMVVKFFRQS
ncbi:MAG: 2-nitropropane dioxygenase [Bacteroidetes bacterium RIFOXYA12_FULL_35_11]|nr:MAG: 2-nitropropane dioxygenase [Bacteroidetes bacterium GWF2_35_48]OFY81154.1 MAG: 2-nitropropane dioxygenase [Bacteroidetes bacterium RIFOXYA12_FULL_35_11]OFY95430.1 MAG: 2-nitropropane dioxygenase [Bacteroidetes bacterium RIFOXYC12_FULL_35_7]OFY96479.1 MAG: 2-nitropropane dioxygenase [Bacteroidetes bacterium RIFOXYB2_FULL_35_7]HBX50980.1 nitronate monooxygenase [Bacteroidales bacterium]